MSRQSHTPDGKIGGTLMMMARWGPITEQYGTGQHARSKWRRIMQQAEQPNSVGRLHYEFRINGVGVKGNEKPNA